MAKRSSGNPNDFLSQTQQNSKWFWGRRRYIPIGEMNQAEWSEYRRNLRTMLRTDAVIIAVISLFTGTMLAANCIIEIRNSGFSWSSALVGFFAILAWTLGVLYIKRLTRK